METTFLVIFTLFMFLQTYGIRSSTMIMTSSNVTCIERERQSLLKLRQGLMDETNRLSTWTGVECCEWKGVGCDKIDRHVVKLDLRSPYNLNTGNWLEGKVSPSLLNLKHLRYLDLSMNSFWEQDIPEFFGSFKYLEYLNLSYSGLGGAIPHHLGNLSRLQYLDLNNNNIYLPDSNGVYREYGNTLMVKDNMLWVSSLSSLKHLDLSGIKLCNDTDWFHPVNALPSLVTLNLASCNIIIPSIEFINFTSLNSLDLSNNRINSTIPGWLSNLTSLMHLNLSSNAFHGQIPEVIGTLSSLASIDLSSNQLNTLMPDLFWNLSSLVRLDLSKNKFYGPIPPSGGLSSLRVLFLNSNRLSGSIPESIGQFIMLEILYLHFNQLNGSIPESIGQLTRLQVLSLEINKLRGNIPTSIGHLSNLQNIYLDRNQLNGSIPESIGLLTRLQELNLEINQLTGSIPTSLGQLSNLRYLFLDSNQLNGSIPESIGLLTSLQVLDLHSNHLSGNIPTSIGQLSNLQLLILLSNQLSGVVYESHFTKLSNLTGLYLNGNSLTLNVSAYWIPPFRLNSFFASYCNIGPKFPNWLQTSTNLRQLDLSNSGIKDRIPEWFENISSQIMYLDVSYNQIGGNLPRITSPGLNIVNLRKNRFSGSVPAHLCKFLSIKILDLSNNNFSGILPHCLWSLINLQVMDLAYNTITGDIPNSLGSLSQLESLHLHNNKFKGNLPMSLQNLTSLVIMDIGNNFLTGNIPFWIGKGLLKLKILKLQSNKFIGKIPLELCQVNNLQHLNLANNNITGKIPHCFSNLTGMITSDFNFGFGPEEYEENTEAYIKDIQLTYTRTLRFLISLDLSNNKIIGEIPDVLMNLASLTNLNLSSNELSGHIPERIGNLKLMESLDLSANKLSGPIPPSLTSLNFISFLNLSFNNLTGPIPVGNQLQTLGDLSTIYEGNTELCGPSLSKSCKRNNLYAHASGDEGKDSSQGLSWFYTGMVSGFVVGFMGLIGSLHFIRIWRVTYFEIIENVYIWLTISILATLTRLRRKFFG